MKIKTLVIGPIFTQTGYGEHTRFVVDSLLTRMHDKFDIFINPINWAETDWSFGTSTEGLQDTYKHLSNRYSELKNANGDNPLHFDLVLCVSIPSEWGPYCLADKDIIDNIKTNNFIGVTAAVETDRAPRGFFAPGERADHIIVPSEHAKSTLDNLTVKFNTTFTEEVIDRVGLTTTVDVVPYPAKNIEEDPIDLGMDTDFNFLSVAQFGARKNLEDTVQWFCEEFRDESNVGLVLKTNVENNSLYDLFRLERDLKMYLESRDLGDKKCKIHILHGSLTKEQMAGLYTNDSLNCFISLTRGEGFGLPLFDAASRGMPVIATGWSAHKEFLTSGKNEFYDKIKYDLEDIAQETIQLYPMLFESGMKWAQCKEKSAKKQMRLMYENYKYKKSRAVNRAKEIKDSYSEDLMHKKMVGSILGAVETKMELSNWLETQTQVRVY